MKYLSTRGSQQQISFSEALARSLAPDGGLYVPNRFPMAAAMESGDGSDDGPDFADFCAALLEPYLEGDVLAERTAELCARAFRFSAPLDWIDGKTAVLELFHGPTAAFKDFGASFLAEAIAAGAPERKRGTRAVLVATSGDTGGAVAAAFHGRPGVRVMVLFPKGRVAPRQEKQLTCWGGNVSAFAVRGDFDDCQRVVKEALLDRAFARRWRPISANSINIGRLLPQVAYYAHASRVYLRRTGRSPGFIIPTGNVGNAVGALWAKRMGFPIRRVFLATNANRSIPDYLATGVWRPGPTLRTLANAMDVGSPSNMERVLHLYPRLDDLRQDVEAASVNDREISAAIVACDRRWKRVICPHTATAFHAWTQATEGDWVVVATAHPAKFETVVEPLIGRSVEVPERLSRLLAREGHATELDPSLAALSTAAGKH